MRACTRTRARAHARPHTHLRTYAPTRIMRTRAHARARIMRTRARARARPHARAPDRAPARTHPPESARAQYLVSNTTPS